MLLRLFLLVLVIAISGTLGEYQYRSAVIRPAIIAALASDSDLRADLGKAQRPGHYRIVNIGNGLTKYCGESHFGCFDPKDYTNADTLIGLSPLPQFGSFVRVLSACDKEPCIDLGNGVWIRAAGQEDVSEYVKRLDDRLQCSERTLGAYGFIVCTDRETIDGLTSRVGYSVGEPYPRFASALVLDKTSAMATIEVDFVTGKSWLSSSIPQNLLDGQK